MEFKRFFQCRIRGKSFPEIPSTPISRLKFYAKLYNFLVERPAGSMKSQRHFIDSQLSATLIGLVKTFQLVDETLYVLHCPMAKTNEGTDWLSLSSEIQNPYFGAKMLKCGEVKNTLQ